MKIVGNAKVVPPHSKALACFASQRRRTMLNTSSVQPRKLSGLTAPPALARSDTDSGWFQRTATTSIRSPFFRSVTNVASLVLRRKKSCGNAT